MARPPASESAGTRDRIIVAAIAAFSREGFSAMTTRRLAAAAEVNVATLSYHFGSKEGLYRACIDAVYERLQARGTDLIPRLDAAAPRATLRAIYGMAREEREGLRLLLREVLDHGRLRARTANTHYLPVLAAWGTLLAGLPEALRPASPEHARRTLVTLGFLISRFATQDEDALREALGVEDDDALEEAILTILETTTLSLLR